MAMGLHRGGLKFRWWGLAMLAIVACSPTTGSGGDSAVQVPTDDADVPMRRAGACANWDQYRCISANPGGGVSNGCQAACNNGGGMECDNNRSLCLGNVAGWTGSCAPPSTLQGCEGCRWAVEHCVSP